MEKVKRAYKPRVKKIVVVEPIVPKLRFSPHSPDGPPPPYSPDGPPSPHSPDGPPPPAKKFVPHSPDSPPPPPPAKKFVPHSPDSPPPPPLAKKFVPHSPNSPPPPPLAKKLVPHSPDGPPPLALEVLTDGVHNADVPAPTGRVYSPDSPVGPMDYKTIDIVSTYEKALEIGMRYIDKINSKERPIVSNLFPVNDGPWAMNANALANTLSYIMKLLHHSCYMLCVTKYERHIYKLETHTSSPFLIQKISSDLDKLPRNATKQMHHPGGRLKELRVMQCIVKPYAEDSNTAIEYAEILKTAGILPSGVFILNLTDAVILRKDNKFPFQMVTKMEIPEEFVFREFVPIFSISGQEGYWDLPFPNYDDINIALANEGIDVFTKWSDKPYQKAVFRGGPTGCGYREDSNMRIRLAEIGNQRNMRAYLDAGIVHPNPSNKTIDTQALRYDPLHGLGYMKTNIPSVDRMTMKGQSEYKYIIHLDGNVNAYRLLNTMRTGSLILRVKSAYLSWADHLLEPNVHYIEVKEDLSDLLERIRWCVMNDSACEVIARNALQFSKKILARKSIESSIRSIIWSVNDKIRPSSVKAISVPVIVIDKGKDKGKDKDKDIRCKKGTRKNKKGECVPSKKEDIHVPVPQSIVSLPVADTNADEKVKEKRCPKGTRKNKDGDCVKWK